MNAFEPRVRHRGYFLETEPADSDAAENESPEGIRFRLRIIRPLRQRVALGAHKSGTRRAAARRYQPQTRKTESNDRS